MLATAFPEKVGLHQGDKLEYLITDDKKVILTPHTVDVRELKNLLPIPRIKVSVKQMNAAIAKCGAAK